MAAVLFVMSVRTLLSKPLSVTPVAPSATVVSRPASAKGAAQTVTFAESTAEFCNPSFTVSQNTITESS